MAEFILHIDGMHCGSCVRRVTQALNSTEGIQVDEVRIGAARLKSEDRSDVRRGNSCAHQGWILRSPGTVSPNDAYAESESLTLPVIGMTCAACQHHVESALKETAGVKSAHVDLMANRANVVFDPQEASAKELIEAIRSAGYDAVLPHAGILTQPCGRFR